MDIAAAEQPLQPSHAAGLIVAENTQTAGAAYVSEAKIYPRGVDGRYQRLRHLAAFVLLGLYYLLPWVRWNGNQAVLLDLPARLFRIFGLVFWPQDFLFLALLLIIAALSLFFFTALAGRLWCGYACPQTVWTEAFLMMERWTEGNRNERMRLDAAPWSAHKLLRKGSKHLLWAVFGLWTGFTFVGFFTPILPLAERVLSFSLGGWETFWILFYGFATWGNAGFLREQVCKYMCPYARFQSAMFDRNSLIISYDPMRGEPRGPRRRGLADVIARGRGLLDNITASNYVFEASQHPSAAAQASAARGTITFDQTYSASANTPRTAPAPEQLGDCVDCTICVQVCPTGIDIRNGLQYECIACGACIDGCNEVMSKLGYPRGLIRYSTQNAIEGKPTRIARPRIAIYATLLVLLMAGWTWGVSHRSSFIAEAIRDRNALYRIDGDHIDNTYTLKIVNKRDMPVMFRVSISGGPEGLRMADVPELVEAPPNGVLSLPLTLIAPEATRGLHRLHFIVESQGDGSRAEVDSRFFGPGRDRDDRDERRDEHQREHR
ncbi:MAG: 4Fe-4S binding protein [Nevskiaceae bacterium]|nr:4Fe-4S binding protein [Nevskiaceae bacterium]